MVGVIIIAVVFTALAGGIFWAAPRGRLDGITNAMLSQSKSGRKVVNTILVATYIGCGLALPIIFVVGARSSAGAQVAGIKMDAAQKQGRELFGEHCAVCHTLAAASAVGKTGPNLDQIKPSDATVLHTIENGCLANPKYLSSGTNCLGYGTMPADIVQGRDAQDVADFVSKVAGHS
jgi:mono/diheme cytochrome c family protein